MEPAAGKSKGRKRKRKDGEDEDKTANKPARKTVLAMRSVVFVGRYVKKEFESGVFLGKIVSYDSGLYRVVYEDEDFEDLETHEAKVLLVGEDEMDAAFRKRKKSLDQYLLKKFAKKEARKDAVRVDAAANKVKNVGNDNGVKSVEDDKVETMKNDDGVDGVELDDADKVERSALNEVQTEVDSESSSDLSDYEQSIDVVEVERPWVPPPQLPPSTGNFGVPEEDVAHLLSVYSFLRSFSVCLFLSPFGLDEFVGALNSSVHNTLLDAIHVALIRPLKSYVETLSSEGSELASKCLRIMDWSLLDSLTWPVFIVQYLTTMRYTEGPEWKEFYVNVWEKDYYTLSAGRKLAILQLLCDDASNSAEIRTEIDNREESEIGPDPDGATVSKATIGDDVDEDGNGDECRLCGMDGTLICCDGCPSSYHSRCIGMMKLSIPEGEWYCPECTINRTGPIVTKTTSLRGAEFFGIDPYEQVFLGSCDHLLVMKASTSSGSHIQYYSPVDIPKVLLALTSSAEYTALYLEICKSILQYWEIPENVFSLPDSIGIDDKSGTTNAQDVVIAAENVTAVAEYDSKDVVPACHVEKCEELGFGQDSLNESATENGNCNNKGDINAQDVVITAEIVTAVAEYDKDVVTACRVEKCEEFGFGQGSLNESATENGNCNIKSDINAQNVVITAENVTAVAEYDSKDVVTACRVEKCEELGFGQDSLNESATNKSDINSVHDLSSFPSQKAEANLAKFYTGSSFKPQAYLNVYINGDFAASAGASLAILSSEEKPSTQTQPSTVSRRKLMSANYSLQAKAFSLAAKRFYWPNYEKRLVEVSRERCGWCLSCKATVISKRGCLLNAAASNAIKGAAKILSSLRQSKNVEGSLASIATYVMFMEESLYGLTVGPFLNSSYRKQWQKHVEEALTLGEIKAYLLEFEKNIRDIAFSTDWTRLVDDIGSESQPGQSAKSVTGPTQKRGTGRRSRKTSIIPELSDADANELSTDFAWWRGGMLSKHIFQKGVLPQMMIKHAARKGGCEKISSVQYVDGLEVPKRSRQFIWRAAVDLSKTASQLALQVRYLDLHVRWNELVCPDQPPQDGKGPEAEASAFRNACIFDKKILGNKISYGVVFENQKHLPSRVLKKVLEVEETGDRKSKNWFLETHIPLYLIKEYEVAVVADVKLPTDIKHVSKSSRLNKRQLNASGKNIFSFLEQKKNNMGKCFCTFCQLDVSFRTAARCSACQGYCHEQCAVGTNIHTVARVEFLITCKRCYIEKEAASKNEVVGDSPTSPLLLQGQESQHSATVIKIKLGKQNGQEKPLAYSNPTSRRPQNSRSGKKSSKRRQLQSDDQKPNDNNLKASSNKKTNSKSKRLCLGLIWKKKNPNDTGTEFRTNNILLKGNPNGHRLAPRCQLCAKPYNSDLTYILCEKCNNWFHAEAVELQESKIVDLFGFKCCRCRRIKIPACPYADPDAHQKSGAKREALANCQRQKNLGSDSDSEFISDTYDEELDWELDFAPAFDYEEEVVNVQEENPYYSYPTIDQVNDDKPDVDFGPGPKKLPVRRHIKPEKDSNVSFEFPNTYSGINNPNPDPAQEESSTPFVEWDVSTNEVADDMMFDYGVLNYEDMEFEPQTYFSFNELLASDEADKVGDPQVTGPATVDCNPEQYQMGITFDEQEPMFSVETGLDMVPCKVCSQTDPCPDLFCQTCGLWLHQHCSPWEEDSSWEPETGWKCGNCKGSC